MSAQKQIQVNRRFEDPELALQIIRETSRQLARIYTTADDYSLVYDAGKMELNLFFPNREKVDEEIWIMACVLTDLVLTLPVLYSAKEAYVYTEVSPEMYVRFKEPRVRIWEYPKGTDVKTMYALRNNQRPYRENALFVDGLRLFFPYVPSANIIALVEIYDELTNVNGFGTIDGEQKEYLLGQRIEHFAYDSRFVERGDHTIFEEEMEVRKDSYIHIGWNPVVETGTEEETFIEYIISVPGNETPYFFTYDVGKKKMRTLTQGGSLIAYALEDGRVTVKVVKTGGAIHNFKEQLLYIAML